MNNLTNDLTLTDDELSLVLTGLIVTLQGYEKHIELHGLDSLDTTTKKVINDMKILHDKLNKEYF